MKHQRTSSSNPRKKVWVYILFGVFLGFMLVIVLGFITAKKVDYKETISIGQK